jgi:hypothetical protein
MAARMVKAVPPSVWRGGTSVPPSEFLLN